MAYRTPELQLIGAAATLVLEESLTEKSEGGVPGCDAKNVDEVGSDFYSLPGNW